MPLSVGVFHVQGWRVLQFVRAAHCNVPHAGAARLRLNKKGGCRIPCIKGRRDAIRRETRRAHNAHRVNRDNGVEVVDSVCIEKIARDINILKDGGILKSGLRYRHAPDDGDVVFGDAVTVPVGGGKHFSNVLERLWCIGFAFQRVAFADNYDFLNAGRIINIPCHDGTATSLRDLSICEPAYRWRACHITHRTAKSAARHDYLLDIGVHIDKHQRYFLNVPAEVLERHLCLL